METTAIVRGVRLSAQKGRLVADLVRGKPVDKALNTLSLHDALPISFFLSRRRKLPASSAKLSILLLPMPNTTTVQTLTNSV